MLSKFIKNTPNSVWLLLLGFGFYIPFLGQVHLFDWDEINFAESAREMLLTGDYLTVQIDFKPFWEKPPLFFWLQVLCMKAFGISEFSARLPNAVIGIVTLQVLYQVGKKLHDKAFGFLWAIAFWGSLAPHLYFKTGIIDPTFNLFIFLSIYFFSKFLSPKLQNIPWSALLAGVFMGLAILTKGPVALLIGTLSFGVFILVHLRTESLPNGFLRYVIFFIISTFLVASIWFGLEFARHGKWFFEQFLAYQIRLFSIPDAGHEQPFYYHFIVLLIGCFPASVFAVKGIFNKNFKTSKPFVLLMQCLFWVVLILFSIVRTKIVHYSSMAWFPVTYLAVYAHRQYLDEALAWSKSLKVALLIIGILIGVLLMAIPLIGMNSFEIMPYIHDDFVLGNLQTPMSWAGWEWAIGLCFIIALCVFVYRQFALGLYATMAITLWLYVGFVVPRIEPYIQGAAIDFYKSFEDQDVYINTLGFKSYAHLYYFGKQIPKNQKSYDENWLLNGKVDKPTYFVTKNTEAAQYMTNPNLSLIKEENGFVFFRRKPRF